MDEELKNDIIHTAIKRGCDSDGDILFYHGDQYYVHIFDRVVRKAKAEKTERKANRLLSSYMQKAQYLNLLMLLAEEYPED